MALSMEERRILAEIEQELERAEPALAAFLSAFGRPGRAAPRLPRPRASRPPPLRFSRPRASRPPPPGLSRTRASRPPSRSLRAKLRSPRTLVVASLAALVLLTVLPVVVYALVSLPAAPKGHPAGHPAVSAQHHGGPPHLVTSVPR